MRSVLNLILPLTLGLAIAVPAAAQRYDHATGYGAGLVTFGAFNDDAGGRELALESGLIAHLFGEGYTGQGRLGWRLSGGFSKRPLAFTDDTRSISTFIMDAGLVARLSALQPGTAVSPFVTAGVGAINYSLGRSGRPVIVEDANVFYPGNDQRQWMATVGGGVDVLPAGFSFGDTPMGFRVDVADHITLRSPFETMDGTRPGPIHNIRFGVALVGFGWF